MGGITGFGRGSLVILVGGVCDGGIGRGFHFMEWSKKRKGDSGVRDCR